MIIHDYHGIINSINRISKDFGDFVPRFAGKEE